MDSFEPMSGAGAQRPGNFSMEKMIGEERGRDMMTFGLPATRPTMINAHPIEVAQRQHAENEQRLSFDVLKRVQGMHAPLKLMMERRALHPNKIGRLPFLQSSNALLESLTGKDLEIDFDDVLNTAEFNECLAQPHAIVEKAFGIF